jgi:hypothetical protein
MALEEAKYFSKTLKKKEIAKIAQIITITINRQVNRVYYWTFD